MANFRAALVILICSCFAAAAPQDSWNRPALSVDPATLFKDAQAAPVPEGASVLILLEEDLFKFEADTRVKHTRHIVARVINKAGADNWGSTSARWEPWHQARPIVRARVITSDGQAHLLDPKTIGEAPVKQDTPEIYSDARILQGPLPAVAINSVVEEESVIEDTAPFFEAGDTTRVFFGRGKGYPTLHARVVLDAPASLPLQHRLHNLPGVAVQRKEQDGRVILTIEGGPFEEPEASFPYTPRDSLVWRYLAISTGKSWAEIARSYSAIVDRQIKGADLHRLLPSPLPKGTPKEIAAQLLARLHQEIRYAAVEFGDAGIVPRTPAEVLQRRYGDCKDQAALLAALLRASGVPAHVALLNIEATIDPEPELPGFGQFDHAITYVPASSVGSVNSPAFWIDPTDEDSGAGEIPAGEQGRMSLVASAETTGLIRIPEVTSADNRQVETREFHLSEAGDSRIVEVTEAWGALAHPFREMANKDAKKLKEDVASYVKQVYLTSEITKVEVQHKGLELPAKLMIAAEKVKRGTTTSVDAAVYVRLESAVSLLPRYFEEAEDKKKRNVDFVLPEPFIHEIRYHVIPPPGYVPHDLPQGVTNTWGQAKYTQEYRAESDGSITAIIRFDTGPRRMSAEDAEALHKGVLETYASRAVVVGFEQKGMALLQTGKVHEALAEFRALNAMHPKEALHLSQISEALLEAGLGEAARAEARRAVELEPKSFAAHRQRAFVLERDLIGRLFKKGFDREGVAAEFREAIKLEPDNADLHLELASLLEHGPDGLQHGPGSQVKEAIAEYKGIAKDIKGTSYEGNPVIDLIWLGEYAEAKKMAQALSPSPERNYLLLTAAAAIDSSAAVREGNQQFREANERIQAFSSAGQFLIKLRMYQQASALLRAAAPGSQNPTAVLAQATQIGQMKRFTEVLLPGDDPRSVVQRFLMMFLRDDPDLFVGELKKITSKHVKEEFEDSDATKGLAAGARQARAPFAKGGLSPDVGLDLLLGAASMTSEGDKESGFRVQVLNMGQAGNNLMLFVVWEDGAYKIIDIGSKPEAIGREVLARIDKGDLAGAKHWLDWVRAEVAPGGGDDPLAGPALPRFWTKGQDAEPEAMRAAAAALLSSFKHDQRAIPILRAGLSKATGADRTKFELVLGQTLLNRDQCVELQPLAENLVKQFPKSTVAAGLLEQSFVCRSLWKEARDAAAALVKQLPDDPLAIRMLGQAAARMGDYAESDRQTRRLSALGKATMGDWNSFGWQALFHPPVAETVIPEVLKGVGNNQPDFAILHTIAMLYAVAGKTIEARDVLWQAMDAAGMEEPEANVWLVVGRMAENFDALASARAAYLKVEKPKEAYQIPLSSYLLAQQGLAAMKKTP